jgi:hypothetical protein
VPLFLLKILRFSAKKVKSAIRTVFKIKIVLGVLIDLFQKREPFRFEKLGVFVRSTKRTSKNFVF